MEPNKSNGAHTNEHKTYLDCYERMFGDSFTIPSEESLQKTQIPAAERRPHKTWIESAWAATAEITNILDKKGILDIKMKNTKLKTGTWINSEKERDLKTTESSRVYSNRALNTCPLIERHWLGETHGVQK